MSIRMSCRPCGRSFRVPHADREWNCKHCGAPLSSAAAQPAPETAETAPAGKEDLRRANAELKRWRESHKALKSYFLLMPGVLLVMLLVAVALVSLMHGKHLILGIAVPAAIGVGFAMRRLFSYVDRHPVRAMITFAVISTVLAITFVIIGATQRAERESGVFVLATVGAWTGVLQAKRGERILATMPEAYRRKAVDDRAKPTGVSVHEQHARRVERQAKGESRLALGIVGGAIALAALGGAWYWFSIQPADPSPVLQNFRRSWESGDIEAIAAHADSPKVEKGLRKYWQQRGWVAEPPDVAGWTQQRKSKERVQVDYELSNGLISDTRWMWSEGRWRLIAFGYPK